MNRKEKEKIATEIADSLFVNGFGQEAKRLVLELEKGPNHNGGGWCKKAVIDRIIDLLP